MQLNEHYREAAEYMRLLAVFIEGRQLKLDYREMYQVNPRSKAIIEVLWLFICHPTNYLSSSFSYWVKRLYYFFYANDVPKPVEDIQSELGIKAEHMKLDDWWSKGEDSYAD